MTGAIVQLIAVGVQDERLTRNPDITNFEASFQPYVNFALESIENTFSGVVDFGKRVQVDVQRNGDLVHHMTLEVTLPELGMHQDLNNPVNSPGGVAWAPKIGHVLVKDIECIIGGTQIDQQFGDWYNAWDELTLPEEKRRGYNRMIGQQNPEKQYSGSGVVDAAGVHHPDGEAGVYEVVNGLQTPRTGPVGSLGAPVPAPVQAKADPVTEFAQTRYSHPRTTLNIPLRFWFNCNPGLALPLIALQFHQVRIQIEFRHLDECVALIPDPSIDTDGPDCKDNTPKIDRSSGAPSLQGACLFVEYVYLDNDARQYYAQNSHEYLFKQLQFTGSESINSNNGRFRLNFNHPTTELVWYTQEDSAVTQCAVYPNRWHSDKIVINTQDDQTSSGLTESERLVGGWDPNSDFPAQNNLKTYTRQLGGNQWNYYEVSDPYGPISQQFSPPLAGGLHINPVIDGQLQFNGQERFQTRSGEYFNEVQPYYHHTRVPESRGIYVYSFALNPEEYQPQGTCNLSRVDTATLRLKFRNMNAGNPGKLYVFAVNYNFFRVAGGMGGIAFAA